MVKRRAVSTLILVAMLAGSAPHGGPAVSADPGPTPAVALSAPSGVFLNESFQLTLSFSNTGDATGFGPVVELIVPPGVTPDAGSASFLGAPVTVIDVGVFDSSQILVNPLTGLDVTGTEGYQLLIIEYPLGSFTTTQPAAVVTLNCQLNSEAVLGIPENFTANPLFRFGADAEDNPTVDPPVFGATASTSVTPTVITLQKSNDADENETATGPNYPVTYTLTVDIANLADIEYLTVIDVLPGNLQFIDVIADGGATVTEPSTSEPGGSIVFSWADTTTGVLGGDITLQYRVYAPELDDEAEPVIDPETGSSVPATNEAEAAGNYDDGSTPIPVSAQAEHTLTLRSIAVQKGVAVEEDNNASGVSPGDVLEYTIDFQISDYFAFQDIVVTDVVGDGQTFLDSFTPVLEVTEGGQSGTWAFTDGDTYDWTANSPADGETTLVFDVSKLLDDENFGVEGDGSLEGDEYTDDTPNEEPATGTITFRTVIDEAYQNPDSYPGGNEWLGAGDSTGNAVGIAANLMETTTGVSDSSAASVTISTPTLEKAVYAINGSTSPANYKVAPGETVTFSLRIEIGAGETEDLVLIDYLPIPFLDVTELSTYDPTQSNAPPAAGSWKLAADDTLSAFLERPPSISTDGTQNTIAFDWGSFHEIAATPKVAHVLFTLTATDEPMANELYLANLAFKQCQNSEGELHAALSVDHIITQQPFLAVTKGIAATNGGGTIDPLPTELPIDGDLDGADGGDEVTFVITVVNEGGWPAYDVTVTEQTPAGLSGCAIVADGVQVNLEPTAAYSGDLFAGGVLLTNPLQPGDVLTIEYRCTIDSDVYPRQELVNTARVTKYTSTGEAGAPNFVQDQSLYEDDATVTIAEPGLEKALHSSSETSTAGASLTIGEQVTFEFTLTLPESEMTDLTLTDDIPAGFRYEDGSLIVLTTGSAVTLGATATVSPASPHAFGSGEDVSITFEGTTRVYGAASLAERQVTLRLTATVLDHASNSWLTPGKTNTVTLDWDENPGEPVSDDLALAIVEPRLTVTKNMSPNPATGGETITVTLTVANSGTSTAFDVVVTDALNTTVFDTATVLDTTASLNGFTFNYVDPTVTYSGGTIAAGASQVFTFTVPVKALVITGSSYPNTGTADYSSLPGDDDDERDYTASGIQNLSISRTSIGKSIIATSEPDDISSGNNVVVGEVITYQVTLQVPANSTTHAMRITDNFPANVAYIAGTAEIARSSADVTSATFAGWAAPGDFAAITPDEEPAPVRFQLGDVVNGSDSGETITLRFDVVVRNVTGNQSGTVFRNRASVRFRPDLDQFITVNSNWVSSTIRAPSLRIDKTATPSAAIGGETVSFMIEVENQSASNAGPAFDLRLTDPLASYYGAISNLLWVITGSGVGITDNTAGSALDIEIDRLDPGEKVVFTFDADLASLIPHGTTVPNTSTLTGTSLPGENGTGNAAPGAAGTDTGERTGDGGINDLQVTDPAEVSIDLPSMEKSIVSPQSSYPIGGTVTFEIVVGVPTGYSDCIKVEDTLPAGLEFVPGSVQVTIPASIAIENTPADESNSDFFAVDGDLHRFQFGEVVASESANLVLRYDVVVANILTNQNGTMLENSAELRKLDPSTGGCILLVQDDATATVGEPYIQLKKRILSTTAGLTNGDLVDFQIDINNIGNQTAYGLIVSDTVAPDVFASITAHSVTASFSPEPVFDTGSLELGPFDLAPGEWVTLLFTAELHNVPGGATIVNTAAATFTSLPNGEGRTGVDGSNQDDDTTLNNYNVESSASFTADSGVGILKEVCPSHSDDGFAIGEVVIFRIQIDLLELTTENVVVIDTLPDYLEPLPGLSEVTVGNPGIWFEDPGNPGDAQPDYDLPQVTGQVLTFDLGNIHNPANGVATDDYVVIEVHARVQNVVENQNGEVRNNSVEVRWTEEGEPYSLTDDASITIVEPDLQILKSAAKTELTIGDEVTYSITIRHTAASTADAFDLVILDTLADNMSYVPGSCSLPASQVAHTPGSPETLRFEIPLLSLADHDVTFTYRCVLDYDEALVDPPVLQINSAVLTYTSMTGDEPGERTGEDDISGALDDYADDDGHEITPIIRTTIRAEKTVVDANGGELIGGDVLIYTIVLTNTSGTAHNVVFTDPIPAFTSYVANSLSTDKAGATVDDSGDPLIVHVGDMVQDEVVTITFRVRVHERTPAGTIITNQGTVDSDDTTPSPSDDPDDPTSDTDPTDIVVIRPLPVVGGEALRPDKGRLLLHLLCGIVGFGEN